MFWNTSVARSLSIEPRCCQINGARTQVVSNANWSRLRHLRASCGRVIFSVPVFPYQGLFHHFHKVAWKPNHTCFYGLDIDYAESGERTYARINYSVSVYMSICNRVTVWTCVGTYADLSEAVWSVSKRKLRRPLATDMNA